LSPLSQWQAHEVRWWVAQEARAPGPEDGQTDVDAGRAAGTQVRGPLHGL